MRASELFAQARGIALPRGDHQCFYCGANCDESNSVEKYVKGSFTGWSGVANPSSDSVCGGCVATMDGTDIILTKQSGKWYPTQEDAIAAMPDKKKSIVSIADGYGIPQRIRNYSWIVTNSSAQAFTKAHVAELRAACLRPPEPPFAIIISDSGQKQLLYRAPVCPDSANPTVMLEDEQISYSVPQLQAMLELCGKLIAAVGKPALKEPLGFTETRLILETWPGEGEKMIEQWERIGSNPVARLALWLSDNKEKQRSLYGLD